MAEDNGALICYVGGMFAGATLGAIVGVLLTLDGGPWARIWQLAVVGCYLGIAAVAWIIATMRGDDYDDADDGRSDARANEDGRRAA